MTTNGPAEIDLVEIARAGHQLAQDRETIAEVLSAEEAAKASLLERAGQRGALKWAKEIAWTLSKPGKMPCYGYSVPASACKVGQKLAQVEGSVCEGCYALKGRYNIGNVQDALHKRLESLQNPLWVLAMSVSLTLRCEAYFRWHDSGDFQTVRHLAMICSVCRLTPHIQHWLPTRERSLLRRYLRAGGAIPDNLIIRLSGAMRDSAPPRLGSLEEVGVRTSTVYEHKAPPEGSYPCPSSRQGNKCLQCRACWSRDVADVSYAWH